MVSAPIVFKVQNYTYINYVTRINQTWDNHFLQC